MLGKKPSASCFLPAESELVVAALTANPDLVGFATNAELTEFRLGGTTMAPTKKSHEEWFSLVGKGGLGAAMPTFSVRLRSQSKLWSLGKVPSPTLAMTWQLGEGRKAAAGLWGIRSAVGNSRLELGHVLQWHLLLLTLM